MDWIGEGLTEVYIQFEVIFVHSLINTLSPNDFVMH